jgi:hypothetical protein
MRTLFLGEHRDNIDPIRAGEVQEWERVQGARDRARFGGGSSV